MNVVKIRVRKPVEFIEIDIPDEINANDLACVNFIEQYLFDEDIPYIDWDFTSDL